MGDADTDIKVLQAKHEDLERRVVRLEANDERHEKAIQNLFTAQEATKVYVDQILKKLDQLEDKIFAFLSRSAKSTSKENADWKDLVKWIIKGTIILVLGYIFGKGGLPV